METQIFQDLNEFFEVDGQLVDNLVEYCVDEQAPPIRPSRPSFFERLFRRQRAPSAASSGSANVRSHSKSDARRTASTSSATPTRASADCGVAKKANSPSSSAANTPGSNATLVKQDSQTANVNNADRTRPNGEGLGASSTGLSAAAVHDRSE